MPLADYTEYGWPSYGAVVCPFCGWEYHKRVDHPKRCPGCQRHLVERKLQGGTPQICPDCHHGWTTRRPYASRRCPNCDHVINPAQPGTNN
jgi:predicted Zn-ribbon and HTH transcriptional regulator